MEKKLTKIYSFLKANRKYNMMIQVGDYRSSLLPYTDVYNKVYTLLYNVHNSQSQVNMDKAAGFYKSISDKKSNLLSFTNFLTVLGGAKNSPITYKYLHELLEKQDSWGNKTAALFVKAIYNTHAGYAKQLKFWEDAPTVLNGNDELYLPVDAVIYFIFEQLGKPCSHTFSGINNYIKSCLPKSDFEVWDDLWFWGFITQKGGDKKRKLEFNEAKYWNLLHSPKDNKSMAEISSLAKEFIKILKIK